MTAETLIEKLEAQAAYHDAQSAQAEKLLRTKEAGYVEAAKSNAIHEAIAIVREHETEVIIENDRVCIAGKWFVPAPGSGDPLAAEGTKAALPDVVKQRRKEREASAGRGASRTPPKDALQVIPSAEQHRMPDGRPISGEDGPHDLGEHLAAPTCPFCNESDCKPSETIPTPHRLLGSGHQQSPEQTASLTEEEKLEAVELMLTAYRPHPQFGWAHRQWMADALNALLEHFTITRKP